MKTEVSEDRCVLFTVLPRNTSRHRSAGSLLWSSPHHPIGRTPARSPSRGGVFMGLCAAKGAFSVNRSAGPDRYLTIPKACPHAVIGTPPQHSDF